MDARQDDCPWCAQRSGRYNMTRRCCQLRYLALSPAPRRQAVYARVAAREGRAAAAALAAQVGAWHRLASVPAVCQAAGSLAPADERH